MASTEGSREVEAARKRLAAARAHEASARRMIDAARSMAETAKKTEEEARSLLERSRGEAEEAEAFLKEAEKRREATDSGDENEGGGRRNKKRKGAPAAAAGVLPTAAAGAGSAGAATGVEEVVVEGAGTPEVNGTYRRCRTDDSDALPSGYLSDCPMYSKGGLWEGEAVNFFIFRTIYNNHGWYITCQPENHSDDQDYSFYCSFKRPDNDLPPKDGWVPNCDGTHPADPAPQLQW